MRTIHIISAASLRASAALIHKIIANWMANRTTAENCSNGKMPAMRFILHNGIALFGRERRKREQLGEREERTHRTMYIRIKLGTFRVFVFVSVLRGHMPICEQIRRTWDTYDANWKRKREKGKTKQNRNETNETNEWKMGNGLRKSSWFLPN